MYVERGEYLTPNENRLSWDLRMKSAPGTDECTLTLTRLEYKHGLGFRGIQKGQGSEVQAKSLGDYNMEFRV